MYGCKVTAFPASMPPNMTILLKRQYESPVKGVPRGTPFIFDWKGGLNQKNGIAMSPVVK